MIHKTRWHIFTGQQIINMAVSDIYFCNLISSFSTVYYNILFPKTTTFNVISERNQISDFSQFLIPDDLLYNTFSCPSNKTELKWIKYIRYKIYLILDFASIMPDNKRCFSPLWNFIEVIFFMDRVEFLEQSFICCSRKTGSNDNVSIVTDWQECRLD